MNASITNQASELASLIRHSGGPRYVVFDPAKDELGSFRSDLSSSARLYRDLRWRVIGRYFGDVDSKTLTKDLREWKDLRQKQAA